ncbi:hypothetical protein BDZ97DRAFT_1249643 [Flammula alnicola]|nr:hypothetical protein BDZ97DRAFT_1249643 [Flammula alnicola]
MWIVVDVYRFVGIFVGGRGARLCTTKKRKALVREWCMMTEGLQRRKWVVVQIYKSWRLNSAWVKSSTKVVLKFFGGSMSLTVFDFDDDFAEPGCRTCEMVGNGRKAREEGNEGLRFATMRFAAGIFDCDECASGDETAGRETATVMAAVTREMSERMVTREGD